MQLLVSEVSISTLTPLLLDLSRGKQSTMLGAVSSLEQGSQIERQEEPGPTLWQSDLLLNQTSFTYRFLPLPVQSLVCPCINLAQVRTLIIQSHLTDQIYQLKMKLSEGFDVTAGQELLVKLERVNLLACCLSHLLFYSLVVSFNLIA